MSSSSSQKKYFICLLLIKTMKFNEEEIIKKIKYIINDDIKIICYKKNEITNTTTIIFEKYNNKLLKSNIKKSFMKINLKLIKEIGRNNNYILENKYYKNNEDQTTFLFFQKTKW
jgi:hypothetical protein